MLLLADLLLSGNLKPGNFRDTILITHQAFTLIPQFPFLLLKVFE
jgi:hypothetical protein